MGFSKLLEAPVSSKLLWRYPVQNCRIPTCTQSSSFPNHLAIIESPNVPWKAPRLSSSSLLVPPALSLDSYLDIRSNLIRTQNLSPGMIQVPEDNWRRHLSQDGSPTPNNGSDHEDVSYVEELAQRSQQKRQCQNSFEWRTQFSVPGCQR